MLNLTEVFEMEDFLVRADGHIWGKEKRAETGEYDQGLTVWIRCKSCQTTVPLAFLITGECPWCWNRL